MKSKHLSLAIAALLTAGGLWFAWSAWRTDQFGFHKSRTRVSFQTISDDAATSSEKPDENSNRRDPKISSGGKPNPGPMLRPPIPNRRFTEFTPEQRVEFARKGHGPGG